MSAPVSNTTTPVPSLPQAVSTNTATPVDDVIPSALTLQNAAKLAIKQDKKIMLDYYVESLNSKAFIGEDHSTKERVLIKTRKDFTSLIQKIFKVADDFLVMTENSVYIVSANIKKRQVNLASLDYDYNDDE